MEHYCPDRFSRQFGFHQDVPTDLDFDNLPDPETILRYHQTLTCYEIGSQVLLPEAMQFTREKYHACTS